jgi:xanthine dehydrogenase accessory factor
VQIDPVQRDPRVVVFGVSPVARALARLADAAGYAVDAVDPAADPAMFPATARVVATFDEAQIRQLAASAGSPTVAVIATMGRCDEEALVAALALEPHYLGMAASRTRFDQLREVIQKRGVAPGALERVTCPAGLEIGARTPEEIAVSVLAEIILVRRAAESSRTSEQTPPTVSTRPAKP